MMTFLAVRRVHFVATLWVLAGSFLLAGCDPGGSSGVPVDPAKNSLRAKKTQEAKEKAKADALKK